MLQLLLDDLGGLLKKELGMCLMLLPALETLFLQGCVTQPSCEGLCQFLLYLVLCLVDVPRRPVHFWQGGGWV